MILQRRSILRPSRLILMSTALRLRLPNVFTPPPPVGDAVYVSPNGSASNSGTSPDFPKASINTTVPNGTTMRLERGAHFNNASLGTQPGVTYATYGSGPNPVVGGVNMKLLSFTNEGSGVWSCSMSRPGGVGTSHPAALRRNDTWFLNGSIGRKTALADLAQNGDFYHPAGGTLYIFNSGGNPATDNSLSVLRYGATTNSCNINVDDVMIDSIDFEGSHLAAFNCIDCDNIHVLNSRFNGHRECGVIARITETNDVANRSVGHVIFEECNANWVGYRNDQSSNIFFNGGGAGQHQMKLLEILGGYYGPICGTDCVTNNGSVTFPGVTDIDEWCTTKAVGATFENTFGENPWDSKTGNIIIQNCHLIGNGTVESPPPLTCQNFTLHALVEDCTFELDKQFACGSFTSNPNQDVENKRYTIRRNEFIRDYTGTVGPNHTVLISNIDDTGAFVIFEDNIVHGQLSSVAVSTCLRLEGNFDYRINRNQFIRHGAGRHITRPSAHGNMTFGAGANANTTPDAGGLVIVDV